MTGQLDTTFDRAIECETCMDSGWEPRECTGSDCGRRRRHPSHRYVTPCECRPVNRSYQDKKARNYRRAA